MSLPASRSATVFKYGYGAQSSIFAPPFLPATSAETSASIDASDPCIFQFPATNFVRPDDARVAALIALSSNRCPLRGRELKGGLARNQPRQTERASSADAITPSPHARYPQDAPRTGQTTPQPCTQH